MNTYPALLFHAVDTNARQAPENTAFEFRGEILSNTQLAQKSNQLANLLLSLGIEKGARVGIFSRQSLHVPVAIFGIQKTGAAYAPIDPKTPARRLLTIIQELGIEVLITQDTVLAELNIVLELGHNNRHFPLRVLVGLTTASSETVDTYSWQSVFTQASSPPMVDIDTHDLAYVMTTSGSTGTPKGIMHTHYSGLAYARLSARTYDVTARDCLGNFVPLHFDISTFAYFVGPLSAARVVLIPEEYLLFPTSLVDLVEEQEISIWYSAPYPLIEIALNDLFTRHNLKCLRWVKFGGESMHPKYLQLLMQQLPDCSFSNVYGPAEVNQCTYHHFVTPPTSNEPLPLGKVWAETDYLVINEEGEIVTDGTEGELLIHSSTMMQGYWNNATLNRAAFYNHSNARKYYRTGDLTYTNDKGELVFAGRKDRQVKLRGYRIELDEVESVLITHPIVLEAAALLSKNSQNQWQIHAWVSLYTDKELSEDELIAHAGASLPAYATPRSIAFLKLLPRTTTGKIDRLALPQVTDLTR